MKQLICCVDGSQFTNFENFDTSIDTEENFTNLPQVEYSGLGFLHPLRAHTGDLFAMLLSALLPLDMEEAMIIMIEREKSEKSIYPDAMSLDKSLTLTQITGNFFIYHVFNLYKSIIIIFCCLISVSFMVTFCNYNLRDFLSNCIWNYHLIYLFFHHSDLTLFSSSLQPHPKLPLSLQPHHNITPTSKQYHPNLSRPRSLQPTLIFQSNLNLPFSITLAKS
jgi:hypothetical protein